MVSFSRDKSTAYWVINYLSKNIINTSFSVTKCHVQSLTLKNILTIQMYTVNDVKCKKTELNLFSFPLTRT